MNIDNIERVCGPFPKNFVEPVITDNSYVFENDPNFNALNLYNFFGDGATVNSFSECFYYVNEGWDPLKVTIFDIAINISVIISTVLIIYLFFKSKFFKNFSINNIYLKFKSLISFVSNQFNKASSNKPFLNKLMITLFLIQNIFTFGIVKNKAANLKPFIDEFISLSSNVNFYKSLNFNAGDFIGGNYSVALTSGPISSIGSVIGWNLTNNIVIARIANFYWIHILQILFILLIGKYYKKDIKFLLFSSNLMILLIPWWHGSLYSIGELASLITFVNSMFLFQRARNISILLFSISIIFGKLLNLVPFAGFYIAILLSEKKIKKVFKDFFVFCIPLTIWLLLVNSRYVNGNALIYLQDQFNFIVNHQSSGTEISNDSINLYFFKSTFAGEFLTWNIYDKFRILIVPIIFIVLVLLNKKNITNNIGNLSLPFILAISFSYTWFWFLNSTKWIRYSQHFTILIIFGLFYFLSFKVFQRNIDLVIAISLIALFIENNKYLIWILIILSVLVVYKFKDFANYSRVYLLIFTFLILDYSIKYFQETTVVLNNEIIKECVSELATLGCLDAYQNSGG